MSIKKKGKAFEKQLLSKNNKKNKLSKELLDYHLKMEHIEREANIGQIFLSKSEEAAKKVKILSFNDHTRIVYDDDIDKIN